MNTVDKVKNLCDEMGLKDVDVQDTKNVVSKMMMEAANRIDREELIMELERKFDVAIPDEEFETKRTIDDIAGFIDELLAAKEERMKSAPVNIPTGRWARFKQWWING